MATVVEFMPMNLRLYDEVERDLRTYVSPTFSCVGEDSDGHGVNTHIVADNGGGKSTLLLFFELLFCKPDSQSPNVGGKKVIDYLRRAADDLHDKSPTTMAAVVRRDDPSLMQISRNVVFGYTVRLRGSETRSLDLRRFVIHLDQCPGYSLDRLARDCVFDESGAPLMAPDVLKRLREIPGCRLFESSDWDDYARQMAEAGVSPILWRELARMNSNEEAAENYFHTRDAFRKIVGLVHEAQQPVSGERAKPLADVATDVARNVASQKEDRARKHACDRSVGALATLAERVRDFAEAREGLKLIEDEANSLQVYLRERGERLGARICELEARSETYKERRRENERFGTSERFWHLDAQLSAACDKELALRVDRAEKERLLLEAKKAVALDDAARSWRRYQSLEEQIGAKRNAVDAMVGRIGADEELAMASVRAWRNLRRAESSAGERLERAVTDDANASEKLKSSVEASDAAERELGRREHALGGAESTLEAARQGLIRAAEAVPEAETMPLTFEGLYPNLAIESALKSATKAKRDAAQKLERARKAVETNNAAVAVAQDVLHKAEVELARAADEATRWTHNLDVARERDNELRNKLSLWEDIVALVVEGRCGMAMERARELMRAADADEASATNRKQALESRIKALESGRLEMSEGLRAWLDRHGIAARTLASHEGIPDRERNRLFNDFPWLAHALVVDDAARAMLASSASGEELSELGHAVFYIRQADVQRLLDATRTGSHVLADKEGRPLVEALRTVDRGYWEDPEGYADELRARLAQAGADAEEARRRSKMLDDGRNAINAFLTHLSSIGMAETATLADVIARADEATKTRDLARKNEEQRRGDLANAQAVLEAARDSLASAEASAAEAEARSISLQTLRAQNEECAKALNAYEECEELRKRARADRDSAKAAVDNARQRKAASEEALRRARGEHDAVAGERTRLESICPETDEQSVAGSAASCSVEELKASVDAVVGIMTRLNQDLERERNDLARLLEEKDKEIGWKNALRDSEIDGFPITLEEIKSWVPCGDADRSGLRVRKNDAQSHFETVQSELSDATAEVRMLVREGRRVVHELRKLQLDNPLEVPLGYDYEATAASINEDEQADNHALKEARDNKERVGRLEGKARDIATRSERADEYRASSEVSLVELEDLVDYDVYVGRLEERRRQAEKDHRDAAYALDEGLLSAKEAILETNEHTVARNVEESVASVRSRCRTLSAMRSVADGLDNRSIQFQNVANTLREKLRTTDESIEDLVARSVEEGNMLATELHRLVTVSRVGIAGRKKQPTIEFRSRGSVVFRSELPRDELAAGRLSAYVRGLLTEELPSRDEAQRQEYAKTHLAPHELLYQLLGDRSVDVRYPVIRGGRSLSYESVRDTGGSGSTGQKTAGYVLSFLALLRYLGNSGALSKETSLFVALENQFGKISSTSIIRDIKKVSDQSHLQLITVAGRELASAYEMADVVFSLYSTRGVSDERGGTSSAMRARRDGADAPVRDAVIDHFRATRRFENLSFDF